MAVCTKRVWSLLRSQVKLGKVSACKQNVTQRNLQILHLRWFHPRLTNNGVTTQTKSGRTLGLHSSLFHNVKFICLLQPRFSSTVSEQILDPLPPVPPLPSTATVPEQLPDISNTLNVLGEPTLQSLGLCNYTPAGFVQFALETLHVNAGLPWFGAIIAGTLILRTMLIPLLIKAQRSAVNMHNYMPVMQSAKLRMDTALASNDQIEYVRASKELQDVMTKFNPLEGLIVPLCQVPIFLSVFSGLRAMAYLPVESLKTGGFLWITDLTIPDPYFILPIVTSLTLLATLEVGADTQSTQHMSFGMKIFMRVLPFVILPIIGSMPAAMCTYWCTANFFSLTMVAFMKIPALRKFCKIGQRVVHPPALNPNKFEGGIWKGMKEGMKERRGQQDRQLMSRLNADNFRKAGQGPIPKTYVYNPKVENHAPVKRRRHAQ